MQVDELLIEFAEARFDFFEIVGEALDLSGHGVETRAGIGLHVLNGFLQAAHGGVELADIVAGLFDQRLHDGVVLGHLGGEIFLSLEQGGDVALQLDEFAGDGFGGAWTEGAAGDESGEGSGAEDGDVAGRIVKPPRDC